MNDPIAAAILTLLVIGAVGFFTLSRLKTETSKIVNGTLPRLGRAGEINSYQAENFIRALLVSSNLVQSVEQPF